MALVYQLQYVLAIDIVIYYGFNNNVKVTVNPNLL